MLTFEFILRYVKLGQPDLMGEDAIQHPACERAADDVETSYHAAPDEDRSSCAIRYGGRCPYRRGIGERHPADSHAAYVLQDPSSCAGLAPVLKRMTSAPTRPTHVALPFEGAPRTG